MNWLAFFLMLPHLKPKCLDILNPDLYRGLDLLRILSLTVICALFLRAFIKEKKLPSPVSWLLGVMEAWILMMTLRTGGDIVEICSIAVSVMAIVLLVDLYADRMKELLAALMLNYEWMVYANLHTVWKYGEAGFVQDPDYGNMPIYFFGPDNWFMYLCIPAVCVALLYLRVRCRDKLALLQILRGVLLVSAAYLTIYLSWPATAVVAMAVLAVVLVIGMIPGIRYCVSFPVVLIGGIGANLAITVFRVMETVPFIKFLVEDVLHKRTTLSGRTPIWNDFIEVLPETLWRGIGNPAEGYALGGRLFDHLHNQYFDLLAMGGIPALTLFLAVLLLIGWMLARYHKTVSSRIMTACMAGLLVMCIPEACRHGSIFLLFPLAYHVLKIESDCCPPAPLS